MCTYLYGAFSLRSGADEGLTAAEAEAVARWRHEINKRFCDGSHARIGFKSG